MQNYELKEHRVATADGVSRLYVRYGSIESDGVWFARSLSDASGADIALQTLSRRFDFIGWDNEDPPSV